MLTADEVIERLCILQSEVCRADGCSHSADCFCGKSGFGPEHVRSSEYRNEGVALEFIEKAVREALGKRESNDG